MKREHLFLEQLSDTQLGHTQKIVQREVARRASERPQPQTRGPRKTGRGSNRATAKSQQ